MSFGALDIQSLLNLGSGLEAGFVGATYTVYRPNGINDPIASPNIITSLPVGLKADFTASTKPNLYQHPVACAVFDRTVSAVGDYLVGPGGTFFIVAQQLLLDTAVVECNAVLTISRPGDPAPAAGAYEGSAPGNAVPILARWPASVLQGTKGERGDVDLPNDTRLPWKAILLPAIPGVQIRYDDTVTDNAPIPNQYLISGAELTDLGWRITAAQVST